MYVERNTDTLMKFHKDRFSFRNHSINERWFVSEKKFSLIIKHKKWKNAYLAHTLLDTDNIGGAGIFFWDK